MMAEASEAKKYSTASPGWDGEISSRSPQESIRKMEFFLRKVGGDWLPESRIGLKTQLAMLSLDGHVGQEIGFDPD